MRVSKHISNTVVLQHMLTVWQSSRQQHVHMHSHREFCCGQPGRREPRFVVAITIRRSRINDAMQRGCGLYTCFASCCG